MASLRTQFKIRPMTVEDLPAAAALWAQTEGIEIAEGDGPGELESYLRRNPGTSLIADSGNRIIAAVLAGHDGRRGFLYHLAVAREHRGCGIGRQLVERSLAALKASGITRVLVLVSRENEPGLRFWEKCGYESVSIANPMGIDL